MLQKDVSLFEFWRLGFALTHVLVSVFCSLLFRRLKVFYFRFWFRDLTEILLGFSKFYFFNSCFNFIIIIVAVALLGFTISALNLIYFYCSLGYFGFDVFFKVNFEEKLFAVVRNREKKTVCDWPN